MSSGSQTVCLFFSMFSSFLSVDTPANRATVRVCGDLLSFSVNGLSENGNQRQQKHSETARTVGRSGSAGAEKRQSFPLPIFRRTEAPPKSAQNRSK